MTRSADVVICGAGIAGVAAAYHLAARQGLPRVLLIDEREPLTLTSDKGTQGYRNWWPGPDNTMLRLVSRSIDLLEETAHESGNVFRMNRRGYLFATADATQAATLEATARTVAGYGMGALRKHQSITTYQPAPAEGFSDQPTGADLLLDDAARDAFPYLSRDTIAALHIRRAGFMNGTALGARLLQLAITAGVEFVCDRVDAVETTGGRVRGVVLASGERVATDRFVVAAGPGLPQVARMLDINLQVFHELHAKFTMRDVKGCVPRSAPFVIWTDPMRIDWSAGERADLEATKEGRILTEVLPGGVHVRPVDLTYGDELYLIWTFETAARAYTWPPEFNASYGPAVLRGCAQMIPAMKEYDGLCTGVVDGGFYCKTPENRPLIGPLPLQGAFVLGALSGSGLMAAHAAAELLSLHIVEKPLPDYARWFLPSRYENPDYRKLIEQWGPLAGQL